MGDDLRTVRGLVGVGAIWALAWGAIGALIGLLVGLASPADVGSSMVEWALGMGAYGAVSGLGFGGLLAYHERRRSVDELSPTRAAVWGVLGSVAVPLLFGMFGFFEAGTTLVDVLEAVALTATLGGTFAGGSVAIAQRARAEAAAGPIMLPAERTEEPGTRPHAELFDRHPTR